MSLSTDQMSMVSENQQQHPTPLADGDLNQSGLTSIVEQGIARASMVSDPCRIELPPATEEEIATLLEEADLDDDSQPVYGPITFEDHEEEQRLFMEKFKEDWRLEQLAEQLAQQAKKLLVYKNREIAYQIFISKPVKGNLIFIMLPREIRNQIWASVYPYCAPVQVITHQGYFPDGYDKRNDHLRIKLPTSGWAETSVPTLRQQELIKLGVNPLPLTMSGWKSDTDGHYRREAVLRGPPNNQFWQINNRIAAGDDYDYDGDANFLHSSTNNRSNTLRVNKQFWIEGRVFLYGHNTFILSLTDDTGAAHPAQQVHEVDELDYYSHMIPGMKNKDGGRQSTHQLKTAIRRLFNRGFTPAFVANDPLFRFFRQIGVDNSFLLARIKITGCMRTVYYDRHGEPNQFRGMGMAHVLKIHSSVLKLVSPNLAELSIDMQDLNFSPDSAPILDTDLTNRDDISDEDKLDNLVQSVVAKLPSLRKLNLEGYEIQYEDFVELRTPPIFDSLNYGHATYTSVLEDPWGRAARWIPLVENRPEWKKVTKTFLDREPRSIANGKGGPKRYRKHKNRIEDSVASLEE